MFDVLIGFFIKQKHEENIDNAQKQNNIEHLTKSGQNCENHGETLYMENREENDCDLCFLSNLERIIWKHWYLPLKGLDASDARLLFLLIDDGDGDISIDDR